MHVKHLAAGLMAAAALAFAGTAEAGDTIKLKLPAKKPASGLQDLKATEADLRTELLETRRYGWGGGWGGGYRGWGGGWGRGYGGWGRGIGWGGYGYRGVGWGGYRGYGWGRGWGWGGGWGRGVSIGIGIGGLGRGWGGYYGGWGGYYGGWGGYYPAYSSYVYAPSYYGGYYSAYNGYAYPCAYDTAVVTTRVGPAYSLRPYSVPSDSERLLPLPREDTTPNGGGTYPYDGGPGAPVPMPRSGDDVDAGGQTSGEPRTRPAVVDDILVHAEKQDVSGSGKWAYPAYGETPRRAKPKSETGFQLVAFGMRDR